MTPQEALNLLNDTEFAEKHQSKEEYTDMLLMCKEALEKQIPKKPIKYDDCEQFFIECPCCQKRFDSRLGYKGCPYCLQAIRLE